MAFRRAASSTANPIPKCIPVSECDRLASNVDTLGSDMTMMKRMAFTGLACAGLLLCPLARAQTVPATRPATTRAVDSAWSEELARLAAALIENEPAKLALQLRDCALIRTFASAAPLTPERLLGVTSGTTVVGTHAYARIPTSLASDLAADVKSADVPDSVRQNLTPTDAAAEKHANEVASQWVEQVLQPAAGHGIGVIVLWPKNRLDNPGAAPKRPLFVLVKADLADGRAVIRQIVFGDPLDRRE